jgi:hypothetical protein
MAEVRRGGPAEQRNWPRAESLPPLPRAMPHGLQHEPFWLVGYECRAE